MALTPTELVRLLQEKKTNELENYDQEHVTNAFQKLNLLMRRLSSLKK